MLFRYSFPIARHGELISVARYVESDCNPTRQEMLDLLNRELELAKQSAEAPDSKVSMHNVEDLEGCVFALQHVRRPDLPLLPSDGSNAISILCDTRLGLSAIRIAVVNPIKLG